MHSEVELEYLAVLEQPEARLVTQGEQGPPGPPGAPGGGTGVSYILDHEPTGAQENETWWNPLTLQMKVFHENRFEPVSPDGGHF